MDVLKLTIRFELPSGVKISPGAVLGQFTQISPGTQLQSAVIASSNNFHSSTSSSASETHSSGDYLTSLTVMEWPYGISLLPGIELVKKPPNGCFLPFEYQQVFLPIANITTNSQSSLVTSISTSATSASTSASSAVPSSIALSSSFSFKLPEDTILVKLPRSIKTLSTLQLSEQITVGVESMLSNDYSRCFPQHGLVLVSRNDKHISFPSEIRSLPTSSFPAKLVQAIEKVNQDTSSFTDLPPPTATAIPAVPVSTSAVNPSTSQAPPSSAPGSVQVSSTPAVPASSNNAAASSLKTRSKLNIELVSLQPHYSLPSGVYLHADVITSVKPFYLHLPSSIVLVEIKKPEKREEILTELAKKGINEVDIALEHLLPINVVHSSQYKHYSESQKKPSTASGSRDVSPVKHASSSAAVASSHSALNEFLFPSTSASSPSVTVSYCFLSLPDVYDVYSWGENLPGVEAVLWNESNHHITLPPGHFLIERPRQSVTDELPAGYALGVSEEYHHLRIPSSSSSKGGGRNSSASSAVAANSSSDPSSSSSSGSSSLPPEIEIMHLLPSYYLPLGINIMNTSIISRNSFNNSSGSATLFGPEGKTYNKKTFDPIWIPQLSPFERFSRFAFSIPWPRDLSKSLTKILTTIDSSLFNEAHGLVLLTKNTTRQEMEMLEIAHYPTNITKHSRSDEIVNELLKAQEKLPQLSALLAFIQRHSVLGRFQGSEGGVGGSGSHNNSNNNMSMINKLKLSHILHVVRMSNGFPTVIDRYNKLSTSAPEASQQQPQPQSLISSGGKRKIVIYPKLSRIERIKPSNLQEEIKKFLNQVLVFRFFNNTTPNEMKEKLDYLQFDLMESSLWKALATNNDLEKTNDKLLKTNYGLEKEKERITEQLVNKQKVLDEYKEKLTKEDDLKAIISLLKEQLMKKDHELSEILQKAASFPGNCGSSSQNNDEITSRYQQQTDILTSQIVQYEDQITLLKEQVINFEQQQSADAEKVMIKTEKKDWESYRNKIENQFHSILSLCNKVFSQLLSSFDQEIFSSLLSKDYNMISFFSEMYNSKEFLEDRQLLLSTGIGGSHNQHLSSASLISHPLNSHSVFSSASVASLPPLTTEPSMISTKTGKKLSFENIPTSMKALHHHHSVVTEPSTREKEYLSLSRPLLLSKSLDSLNAASVASIASNIANKGASLPTVNNGDGIDYQALQSNIDRFLKAKQSKQSSMTFTDSMNFPETSGGSFSLAAVANQKEIVEDLPTADNPSEQQQQEPVQQEASSLFSPAKRGPPNNSEFTTWKSDLDSILRSMNNTFQETVNHLLSQLLTNDPFEKKESENTKETLSRPASRQQKKQTDERSSSSSSRLKRKEIKDKIQQQQQPQLSIDTAIKLSDHISSSDNNNNNHGDINWSSLEFSFSLMIEKFQKIFISLLRKYQNNYHSLLSCIEYENYLLMKSLKHLRLHSSIMKGGGGGGGYNNSNSGINEDMREKVISLEIKVESLLTKVTENESKAINNFISELLVSNELEKSLKFLILIIKQKIAKEQHSVQVILEKEGITGTEGINEEGLSINNPIEEEKEIKGRKHYISFLKNSLIDHEERLKLVKEESSLNINSIYEIIEKFHSSLQSSLPSKLLNSLLHRSQNYFEKYQKNPKVLSEMNGNPAFDLLLSLESPTERSVTAGMKTGGNKTVLSPLRQQGGPVSRKREKSRERPLSSNSSVNVASKPSIIGSMPSASSTNQFSNRYKHQNNEQFEKVNKFFDQTYRKSKY
jgi:hypothetical protein